VTSRAPASAPVRVLLVDDSPWQREGWAVLLGSQPDLVVVGQASDGQAALRRLRKEPVDVVLMDIQMPRLDGLATTERLHADPKVRALGEPRVILLTTLDLDAQVAAAADVGAHAVLYKDVEPEALFQVIRDAAAARDLA
jgi:DNA-binding NarL/FixJ family response regulator